MYMSKNGKILLLSKGMITFEFMAMVEVEVEVEAEAEVTVGVKVLARVVVKVDSKFDLFVKVLIFLDFNFRT